MMSLFQGQMAPVGLVLLIITAVCSIPLFVGITGAITMFGNAIGLGQ